jgi:excisionase family DNA binding protein
MEVTFMNEHEYSVSEAADYIIADKETIRRNIRSGKLKAHMGTGDNWREYRIYESDLEAFKQWYDAQKFNKTKREG